MVRRLMAAATCSGVGSTVGFDDLEPWLVSLRSTAPPCTAGAMVFFVDLVSFELEYSIAQGPTMEGDEVEAA